MGISRMSRHDVIPCRLQLPQKKNLYLTVMHTPDRVTGLTPDSRRVQDAM